MSDFFEQIMADPRAITDNTYDQAFKLTAKQITEFHDCWAAKRFKSMRPKISMLNKLAKEQKINGITKLDDIAPLLFAHSVYKSYPLSYLERSRFDKLTKWLNGLTTHDLGSVDVSEIDTIDDWIDLLDNSTPLRIVHSSGTTGKLSFIPRTAEDSICMGILASNGVRDWNGANSKPNMLEQNRPLINPGYRYGAGTAQRMAAVQVELYAGGDDNALFLYPDRRMSADMLSLAGRLRVAESRGEQGSLDISPALLSRREELITLEKQRPQAMKDFFATAITRFSGQDIYIGTIYGMVIEWAQEGLKRGIKNIFGKNSFVILGGGMKGKSYPDNWRDTVQTFLGTGAFNETYSMTECLSMATLCNKDKYHLSPTTIPFLLDPKTGELLPKKDGTTGRFAFMDLLPDSYWGGVVTGDKVTMSGWQSPCACGRSGHYIEKDVSRYSDEEGGDDKVLCTGAPEAHDKATAFLTDA